MPCQNPHSIDPGLRWRVCPERLIGLLGDIGRMQPGAQSPPQAFEQLC